MVLNKMHLINTHTALVLPYLANPFGVFLLTQNMKGIPTIVVICFMKFIEQWNNFFAPLIYINSTNKFTLTMGMQSLKGFRSAGSLAYILAGVIISLIVPTVVYAFGQKFLTEGISIAGLKS